jgi:hypothetical protein
MPELGYRKQCKTCLKTKDAHHAFFKNSSQRDGYRATCKQCEPPRVHTTGEIKDDRTLEQRTREQLDVVRLRRELQDERARNKQLETLVLSADRIRELVGTLGAPNIGPAPEWLKGPRQTRSVTGTGVMFVSDVHAGEVVKLEQVGGANEFDLEICERRLDNLFKSTIVLLKDFLARPRYEGIVVPFGGDGFSGNIHEELERTNEEPVFPVLLKLQDWLATGIGMLADEFGKVHVPWVTGNHGRKDRKPVAKNRNFENYDWLLGQQLARAFRNDARVTFDIPEGSDAYFDLYAKRVCLTHGDQFRGGDGVGGIIVPIRRGLTRKQSRDSAMREVTGFEPFNVMMIGHWHQYSHVSDLIVNGSVKGYDEYAYQGNFAFEPPTQALFVAHPEAGITARWPVLCDYEGDRVRGKKVSA